MVNCIQQTGVLPLTCDPRLWENIGVSRGGIRIPVFRRDDDFVWMAVQPGTPPRKGGIGDDMMPAAGHEPQIFIIRGVIVDVDKNGLYWGIRLCFTQAISSEKI